MMPLMGAIPILFLSTLSLRRATESQPPFGHPTTNFYPRSPCGERLRVPETLVPRRYQFLSTLSLRRATNADCSCRSERPDFYPRSPCGERQARRDSRQQPAGISIHALLAESDLRLPTWAAKVRYFYPRSPCGERRSDKVGVAGGCVISIHALLAESDGGSGVGNWPRVIFLSTLSLRRATSTIWTIERLSANFYPRSPCGERL